MRCKLFGMLLVEKALQGYPSVDGTYHNCGSMSRLGTRVTRGVEGSVSPKVRLYSQVLISLSILQIEVIGSVKTEIHSRGGSVQCLG
jgi:hypothetical protein